MTPLQVPVDLIRGDYSIYRYNDSIYKIIRFKSNLAPRGPLPSAEKKHYDQKLDSSISRAKRVLLELALCNPWDYFCTFTIDKDKHDRSDLAAWYKKFSQWLRDQRKQGLEISYVFVPERHADGCWHCHGFMRGNMELVSFADERKEGIFVKKELYEGNYLDWPAYRKKFGFCSFGHIKNPVAAGFYVTKYVTKELDRAVNSLGGKMYYASHGLNRAVKHGEIYGNCGYLDKYLVNHYDFCDTGMTHCSDRLDWSFGFEYMGDVEPLDVSRPSPADEADVVSFYDFVQMCLDDLK